MLRINGKSIFMSFRTLYRGRLLPKPANVHPFSFHKFIFKGISEDTATGIVIRRQKQCVHDNCPRYNAPAQEHLVHILTCPHPDVRTIATNLLVELEVWLTQEDTYPSLTPILVASIRLWLNGPVWRWTCLLMAIPTYWRSNICSTIAGLVRIPDGLHCESHCFPTKFLLHNDWITKKRNNLGNPSYH